MTQSPLSPVQPRDGVVFAPQDYAGFLRRTLILAIDFGVICFVYFISAMGWFLVFGLLGDPRNAVTPFFFSWLGFSLLYLTVVEASPLGTLRFLITGVKIVDLYGERPTGWQMLYRLSLYVLPFIWFFDFLWLASDETRQTLRDKFAETYVVRKQAKPVGRGRVQQVYITYWQAILICSEVRRQPGP